MSTVTPITQPSPTASPYPGWNLLLEGAPGSGKTTSIQTLIGLEKYLGVPLEVGVLALDKNVYAALGRTAAPHGPIQVKTIDFAKVLGEADPWSKFEKLVTNVRSLDNDQLQKIDGSKMSYPQMLQIVATCRQFVSDTGVDWGNISSWGTNRVLVLDGLSNLTVAAQTISVGNKPCLTWPDYNVIMGVIKEFLKLLMYGTRCHFVMISHLARENDEISGITKVYPSTIGQKLGPTIGKDFTDVVLAKVVGGKFIWATIDAQAELKATHLPLSNEIEPGFANLFLHPTKGWLARGGVIAKGGDK